jgi:hypothetical protein
MDLTKLNYEKFPSQNEFAPILVKNNFESGTGHNSVIKYKNQWYIVYHGREIDEEKVDYDNRSMRIAKFDLVNKQIVVKRFNDKI